MIRALYSAATGMEAQQRVVDNTANNIANVNTTGFKRGRVDFQDLLYETLQSPGIETAGGTATPVGIQLGHGVRTAAVSKIFSPGTLIQTEKPLDLAIEGDGFFQVLGPNGETLYTRDGAFKVDDQGNVVTSSGFKLQPAISISPEVKEINISKGGIVSVTIPGQTTVTNAGTIQIVRFPNPAGLDARGGNLFAETDASGSPTASNPGEDGAGLILQGFLENSNVQVVSEIIALITAQRAYEANTKVIETSDDMLRQANNVRR